MKHIDKSSIFEEKSVPYSMRMPPSIMKRVKERSNKEGRTMAKQIALFLERALNAEDSK